MREAVTDGVGDAVNERAQKVQEVFRNADNRGARGLFGFSITAMKTPIRNLDETMAYELLDEAPGVPNSRKFGIIFHGIYLCADLTKYNVPVG